MAQSARPEITLPTDSGPSSVKGTSPTIEPDENLLDDCDYVDLSTRSATESIYNYIEENGRSYHRYREGSYLFPNDDPEKERLMFQYELLKLLFDGRCYFAPLDPTHTKKILDIGTGTGEWAVDMAELFPEAEITGTDLSPIQPQWVPPNVHFMIDDAAEPDWYPTASTHDYIHTRMLLGCFEDFRTIIAKAYKYLKPGGYLESQEYMHSVYCDDESMDRREAEAGGGGYAFREWTRTHHESSMRVGRPLRIANKLKRWYERAGFVDVREEVFKLPVNGWPKERKMKELGRFAEKNLLDGLQGFSLAWLHRGFGWTKEEIEVYLIEVRKAISDRSVHAYHKVYVVWGRKPYDDEVVPLMDPPPEGLSKFPHAVDPPPAHVANQ